MDNDVQYVVLSYDHQWWAQLTKKLSLLMLNHETARVVVEASANH